MVIFWSLSFSFWQLVSTLFFLPEKNLMMIGLLLSWSVPNPVCYFYVRLLHEDSNHVGEDVAAVSDADYFCLWFLGSGFRDIAYPGIPLAAMLLCIILCSSKGIVHFPCLFSLLNRLVFICFTVAASCLSLPLSLSVFSTGYYELSVFLTKVVARLYIWALKLDSILSVSSFNARLTCKASKWWLISTIR